MAQKIPLDNRPNQSFQAVLYVDGKNISLGFRLCYNEMAGYWVLSIIRQVTGVLLLDSIPLLTGQYPAANFLEPYAYMKIGSAYIVNVSGSPMDYPDDTNLGTNFVLLWDDTPAG